MALRHNAAGLPDSTPPTRRAFITGTAAAGAGLALGSVAVMAMQPASAMSPGLAALIASVDAAKAAHGVVSDQLGAAYAEMRARVGSSRSPKILDRYADSADALRSLDKLEASSRKSIGLFPSLPDEHDRVISLDAANERLKTYAAQRTQILEYERATDELGIDSLRGQETAASDAWTAAEDAVFAFPAATLADCLAKLQYGIGLEVFEDQGLDAVNVLIADLERIAGKAVMA